MPLNLLNIIKNLRPTNADAKKFLIIFYVVGTTGMLLPFTFELFKMLIPFALLLNIAMLAWFYIKRPNAKELLIYAAIIVIGFFIETLGVNTGKIFGNYQYGNSLGPKIFNTPLVIGFNWLLLVYTTAALAGQITKQPIAKICLASLAMLVYDIVLEQVAPKTDMWYWTGNYAPLQNYVAWFLLAVLFQTIVETFKIRPVNPLAKHIFVLQFLFFTALFAGFKFL